MKKLKTVAVSALCAAVSYVAFGWTAADYVGKDGLILCFDGIDNVGTGTHDKDATRWVDLSGNGYYIDFSELSAQVAGFTENSLQATSVWNVPVLNADTTKSCAAYQTLEMCAIHNNAYQDLFSSGDGGSAKNFYKMIAVKSGTVQVYNAGSHNYKLLDSTWMQVASVHPNGGVESVVYDTGLQVDKKDSDTWSGAGPTPTCLGRGADNYQFKGQYCTIRLYSRELTADEVAKNAMIDYVRYRLGEGDTDEETLTFDCPAIFIPEIPVQVWTGSAICPKPAIAFAGETLTEGEDYELAYENNVNPGVATMTVTGIGRCCGSRTVQFAIRTEGNVTIYADYLTGDDSNSGLRKDARVKTLARALELAEDGDTVSLAVGEQNQEGPVTVSRAVTITGEGASPEGTVLLKKHSINEPAVQVDNAGAALVNLTIDGRNGGASPCFLKVNSGVVTNSIVRNARQGISLPAVLVVGADAVLAHCVVSNCYNSGHNGAVSVTSGLVTDCLICRNRTDVGDTGGINLGGSGARLYGSVVRDNECRSANGYGGGGGVTVRDSGAVISNCLITANAITYMAGKQTEEKCFRGGGIYFFRGCWVYDTEITDNVSYNEGAAVYGNDTGKFVRCLIARNKSVHAAGAVSGSVTLDHCTVADNETVGCGGLTGGTAKNCIIWGNRDVTDSGSPVVSNWADSAKMTYTCTTPLAEGEGNIAANPNLRSRRHVGDYLIDSHNLCAKASDAGTWIGYHEPAIFPGLLLMVW